jgi:hypothetical protein
MPYSAAARARGGVVMMGMLWIVKYYTTYATGCKMLFVTNVKDQQDTKQANRFTAHCINF